MGRRRRPRPRAWKRRNPFGAYDVTSPRLLRKTVSCIVRRQIPGRSGETRGRIAGGATRTSAPVWATSGW